MTPKPVKNPKPAETGGSDWFTPGRFAALLGVLFVASFPQVVIGLESFVRGDSARFAYPVAFYHREAFWRGELPLWNPLNSCGIPFLAQWNTLTLYPLSLFYLIFPMPWSFGIFCLGHLFFAGAGMYFLARRWTGNGLAAAVAGTVFAFNGLSWQGLMWPHMMAAYAWMPWVVLSMERAWREGGRWFVLAALAGAAQMLSGGAEMIGLTWLVLGVLWLAQFFRGEIPRGKLFGRALGTGGLVAGLSAAQMLPFLDLLAHSQRNSGYADPDQIVMPASGWANYLVPLFHGFRIIQGVYVQPSQGWTASYYMGVGSVAFALLGIWRVRDRRVRILAALTLFSLVMAPGGQFFVYKWIQHVMPLLGFMRFPVKFVLLATFALPLLAAYGAGWLQTLPVADWPRAWRQTRFLVGTLLGLMAVILWFAWKYPLNTDNFPATIQNAFVRALFLLLIFGCLWLLRRATEVKLRVLLQMGLVILLWLDVFTHAPNLNPTAASLVLRPDDIRNASGWDDQVQAGVSRAMQGVGSYATLVTHLSGNQETDTYDRRQALFLNLNLLDHVAKFDGFYSLDFKSFNDLFNRVYYSTNPAASLEGLRDFTGSSRTSDPTNAVGWVKRDTFLSLITAGQQPVFADEAATLTAVCGTNFEPRRMVYLPLEARGRVQATNQAPARIVSSHFSAERLEMQVAADAPAMVVVAQSFYHPWHAYVDGKATPLWKANYNFQALEVPAGTHQIRLVYEDGKFLCGVMVSLVSMLGCGVLWFQSRKVLL